MNGIIQRSLFHYLPFLVIVLVLCGCTGIEHARMIRDAQDALSEAAAQENATKFNSENALTGAQPVDPALGYETAVGLVNQALRKSEGDIKADQLYGTALTVRALALWRLGELTEAKNDATEVSTTADDPESGIKIWPRDRIICDALVPLMQVDALADTALKVTFDVQKWLDRSKETQEDLVELRKDAPEGHPMQMYLLQSELELVRVVRFGLTGLPPGERTTQRLGVYEGMRTSALGRLDAAVPDNDPDPILSRMRGMYIGELTPINP